MELAATRIIVRKKGIWLVPSQFGKDKYQVNLTPETPSCTCPDHETRGVKCKHIFAATFVMKREQNADGSTTITESMTVTETRQRTTYPQNWTAYNDAQTHEQDRFQSLLADLCSGLPPAPPKNGRPPLPLSDAVFSIVFKVYSTVSQRRFISDLREAHERGYIAKVPHFNSISNYLENPALTPLLHDLITESSLPLKSVETDFAVDSSGFATSRFTRWFDIKYGAPKVKQDWVKCHIMCGVKTNVVTAIEIHGQWASDTKLLPALVDSTARNFQIAEVSADKGYASRNNADAIAKTGATPFISFMSSHTGQGGGTWSKMYHYFQFKRTEFLQHYHKRSNVESTFSMIKRKFGDSLRSKTDTAMVNETLCKILCHNLVVLIHETHELGIDPVFWTNAA
ncbi:MAG TPA: transposase [Candidatus Angelobacter sp.]|nr:transposase [Candidatus Angelobacter sp.]